MIDLFKIYLASLNFEQLCILFKIFSSIFIVLCFIKIVLIYIGNYLIEYLDLKNRLPWLARFIRLRRIFQNYYLILNFSLIFITLIFMLYVNISTLFIM